MGLDMYLTKQVFPVFTDSEHMITIDTWSGEENIEVGNIESIQILIGEWRKANHIHKWFVDNVQGGIDDCTAYDVSTQQLGLLLETCKKVLSDRDLADELLPTCAGFFFGGLEYNEYYFENIEYTVEILSDLFNDLLRKKMKLLEDLEIEESDLEPYKALEEIKAIEEAEGLLVCEPVFAYRSSW